VRDAPTPLRSDQEYVDGQFVDRHIGDYTHGRTQGLLASTLAARESERHFHTFLSLTVRLRNECYRVPDICVKALPYNKASAIRPDLAIEVVSPDDKAPKMPVTIGDYLAAGVPYIWVVDPYERTLVEASQAGIRKIPSLKLATPLVGEVDFAALFDRLDKPTV
jgi:Uma2 family endonuclease